MVRSPRVLVLSTVVVLLSIVRGLAAPLPAKDIPYHCPAIAILDYKSPNSYPSQSDPPSLVVVGSVKAVSETAAGPDQVCELTIEETLYGFWPAKTVRIARYRGTEEHAVFYLSPSLTKNGTELYLHYDTPVEEIEAARALAAARLDLVAASATTVFTGTELPSNPYKPWREAKVTRVVSGNDIPAGRGVYLTRASRETNNIRLEPGSRLFLVAPSRGQDQPLVGRQGFELISTFPMEMAAAVKEAQTRRDRHILTSETERDITVQFREVLYRGDEAGAVRLIGSRLPAARSLGIRYLHHHPESGGRDLLRNEIAARMLRTDVATNRDFAILKAYIAALGELDREAPTGKIVALVKELLTAIEREPAAVPLPQRTRRPGDETPEEATTDVNHALTWLLSELAAADMAGEIEDRLLALRDRLDGWWKREVVLAMETSDVEQNRALRTALQATADLHPVKATAEVHLAIRNDAAGSMVVSQDSAFRPPLGRAFEPQVFETKEGQETAPVPFAASRPAFGSDGNFLTYIAENGNVKRCEWKTGRVENTGVVVPLYPIAAVTQFSRNGRALLTMGHQDKGLRLWDLVKGVQVREVTLPPAFLKELGVYQAAALSPDGGKLVYQIASGRSSNSQSSESVLETWEGRRVGAPLRFDFAVEQHAFTPDGRELLSMGTVGGQGFTEQTQLRVELRDLETGAVQNFAGASGRFPSLPVISPGGRYAAVADNDCSLFLFELPTLKLVSRRQHLDTGSIKPLAFSADEKLLFVDTIRQAPLVLRTDNLEETFPYAGNPDRMTAAYFSDDNRLLWSVDDSGFICHWDAATMAMQNRILPPSGFRLISTREPDGKYLLYTDGIVAGRGDTAMPQRAIVMNAEIGKEVSRFPVALDNERIFWLPEGEILCINRPYGTFAITLLDYRGGRVISRFESPLPMGPVYLSADRRSLLAEPQANPRLYDNRPAILVNLANGEFMYPKVEVEGDTRVVQGVRYEELRSPWSVPRKLPVRQVWAKSIPSPDGRRLAVITGERRDDQERTPSVEVKQRQVRIHDAKTLEMLYAFPIPDEWSHVRFNADGTQMSVVHRNRTIDRWVFPR